jgi:hypothetical protein
VASESIQIWIESLKKASDALISSTVSFYPSIEGRPSTPLVLCGNNAKINSIQGDM